MARRIPQQIKRSRDRVQVQIKGESIYDHGPNRCRYSLEEMNAFTISAAM